MASPYSKTPVSNDEGFDGTVIGRAIAVVGRIDGEEDLRIRGRVDGSIHLTQTLFVEAEGVVVADVEARDIVVAGVIVGNVSAEASVTLEAGARLVGNIRAPRLIIADGAAFRGEVEMGGSTGDRAEARAASTAPLARRAPAPAARPAAPPRPAAAPAASARPAPRPAAPAPVDTDEDTVIVRHQALGRGELPKAAEARSAQTKAPAPPSRSKLPRGRHRSRS